MTMHFRLTSLPGHPQILEVRSEVLRYTGEIVRSSWEEIERTEPGDPVDVEALLHRLDEQSKGAQYLFTSITHLKSYTVSRFPFSDPEGHITWKNRPKTKNRRAHGPL